MQISSNLSHWQEEDLFIMTYGLPLNGDGDEKCLSILNAVEETISRQLRACKAPSSKTRVLEGISVNFRININFHVKYINFRINNRYVKKTKAVYINFLLLF